MLSSLAGFRSYQIRVFLYLITFLGFQFLLIRNNLFNDFFWLDESGQIWMALGQNHFSSPNSQTQGLNSVLANNATYNLDPGGFTLLLRFWIEIFGVEAATLRLLPYLCYLASVCLLQISVFKFMKDVVARESATIFLLGVSCTPMFSYYAFEVRGYSLSLFLATFCFFAMKIYIANRGFSRYLLLIFGITTLSTIRYTSLTYSVSLIVILLVLDFRAKKFLRIVLSLLFFGLTMSSVFFTQVIHQIAASKDSYLNSHMLSDVNNLIPILRDNFFGFPGIIRSLVILFAFYVLFISRGKAISSLTQDPKFIFSCLSLFITFLQLLLSFFGFLPWHSSTRWSIEDLSFLLVLIMVATNPLGDIFINFRLKRVKLMILLFPLIFTFSALTFYAQGDYLTMKRNSDVQIAKALILPSLSNTTVNRFFVERNLYPTLRYSLELDADYASYKGQWLDAKVNLFSDEMELKSLLTLFPVSPITIVSSYSYWNQYDLLEAGYKCSIVTRLQEIDPLAPSWVSIRLC